MQKKLAIIGFLICLLIMGWVIGANAQNVKQDSAGNYVALKADFLEQYPLAEKVKHLTPAQKKGLDQDKTHVH